MTRSLASTGHYVSPIADSRLASGYSTADLASLLAGEILLETRSHSAWGAAVTARMYLSLEREKIWQQLVDYPRWVHYFPDLTESRVLGISNAHVGTNGKQLYQAARKTFLFLTAQVEIYLRVLETANQRVQFYLESGSFADFFADLNLKDCMSGTLLTYSVQATPIIPIPSAFIQQAIHLDLPNNMRRMRQVICG